MSWKWFRRVHWGVHVALAASIVYVAVVFIDRAREPKAAPKAAPLPLSPDYYVMPPKSYVRSLADAKDLVGKPLWVREGYRWACTPGGEALGPMEKLTVRRAYEKGQRIWLDLDRNGGACAVPISGGDSFFLDEIFLIKDPHDIYKDWKPDAWAKIVERRIEPGMTATQITFALGVGALVPDMSREGDARRVVDYTSGEHHVRVTYAYGVAKRVDPLP